MNLTRPLLAVILSPFFATFVTIACGAPAELDLTFSGDGKVTTPFGAGYDAVSGMAVQDDGKIVVAGRSSPTSDVYGSHFAIARYNSDGSLDPAFNGTGRTTTVVSQAGESASAIAVQSNGKIVVAGRAKGATNAYGFALVRYNIDGSLDLSFNGTGKVITSIGSDDFASAMVIQSDGKIVVVGYATISSQQDFAVVRYNTDGSLDTSFNVTGKLTTAVSAEYDSASGVVVQSDGKIVVSGTARTNNPYNDFAVVRYHANGSLDTAFSGDGKVVTNVSGGNSNASGLALQTDGKIVVSGGTEIPVAGQDFSLLRYNTDGTLDTSFSGDGKVTTPVGSSFDQQPRIALQADGKIVAAGSSYNGSDHDMGVVRYLSNGNVDPTFNGTGRVITSVGTSDNVSSVVLQSDGKILIAGSASVAGSRDFAVVRYTGDLTPFGAWKLQHLGNSSAPDDGDADGDGIPTIGEYGLGLLPQTPDAAPAPSVFDYPDGGRLRLLMPRDPAHNDISVEVLTASALAGPWSAIATSTRGAPFTGPGYFTGDGATPGVKTVEVRDTINVSAAARRFFRLRVSFGSPAR